VEEFDVFLSHHSGDKPWVIALKAALVERGVKVWLDQDEIRPGDLFIDALEHGIQVSRCVAVVVSPESLKSAWVKEEYQRALVLSNSLRRELRIIPCVLRNAELPGFLASRHFVDFRDPARFDDRVNDLCHGITGHKLEKTVRAASPIAPIEITPGDIAFLDRSIATSRTERSQLALMRMCAPIVGLATGLLWPAGDLPVALPYVGSALVTGFLGIGVTARKWSLQNDELKRLIAHRDALELCSQSFGQVCPDVVDAFNRLLKRKIGIESPAAEARA
jgi:hypothetical protein